MSQEYDSTISTVVEALLQTYQENGVVGLRAFADALHHSMRL